MPRYKDEDFEIEEEEIEEEVEEEIKEIEKVKEAVVEKSPKGRPVIVMNVYAEQLLCVDDMGFGIMVDIPDKRKTYNKGETIYI